MRLALVIVFSAAVAVALVHVRREEAHATHEIQRLRIAEIKLRRRLWDQQVRLGYLTAPDRVRRRIEQMCLNVTGGELAAGRSARARAGDAR